MKGTLFGSRSAVASTLFTLSSAVSSSSSSPDDDDEDDDDDVDDEDDGFKDFFFVAPFLSFSGLMDQSKSHNQGSVLYLAKTTK